MAKLFNGILGAPSGKVGGVVAGSWKDKSYIRAYSVPANPNTPAQQAQRDKFRKCVNFAKLLIGQVFNVYTDQFLKSMSGYNYFISRNIDNFADPVNYAAIKITEGKLFMPQILSVEEDPANDAVAVQFSTENGSNGVSADEVYGAVYNVTTGVMRFALAPSRRDSGSLAFALPMEAGDKVVTYIFAAKKTGTVIDMISDSDSHVTDSVA